MMILRAVALALCLAHAAAQNCAICPDGSGVDKSVWVPFRNKTCGDLEAIARSSGDTDCSVLQSHATWCKCPGVEPPCTMCEDGSSPLNLTLIVTQDGLSCEDLEYLATVSSHDNACEYAAGFAETCGCPTTKPSFCTLCPDGKPPPNLDLELGTSKTTCGRVAEIALATTTEEGCDALRDFAAAQCGCEGETDSTNDRCTTLCRDGAQVANAEAIVGETTTGELVTCGEIEAQVAVGIQDKSTCDTYETMGIYACGCQNFRSEELPCKLCEGDEVPTNLLMDVDGKGNTCVEFMSAMLNIADEATCLAFQVTAGVYCGCSNPVASEYACRICGGNVLLPNPQRIADSQSGVACGEAEYVANLDFGDMCSDMQSRFESICCGPEETNPHDTDGLPYSDDIYVDATSPPEFRPYDANKDTSSASCVYRYAVLLIATTMVVFVHVLMDTLEY